MRIPTQEYRRTDIVVPRKLTTGLDRTVDHVVGHVRRRRGILSRLREQAERADARAEAWHTLTDHQLAERLQEFRQHFRRQREPDDAILLDALAAIREASDRHLGLRPYPVQLMGALALRQGLLAEMATGEGKTLTAGLAAVLAGWTGQPCHIITANDYLANRDAQWLEPLYTFCGVSVGYVTGPMETVERIRAYNKDVTYTTSKEIVADLLRDRIRLGPYQNSSRRLLLSLVQPRALQEGIVLRGLHTAIVDEADCLLIDEAVTPLIISSAQTNRPMADVYTAARDIAQKLIPGSDYTVDQRHREVELRTPGRQKIDAECGNLPALWRSAARRAELVQQALTAREFFLKEKQYVILDGKVVIVDEFTGRMMPQRTWSYGLHQAIEAKEGIEISPPSETLARLSFQRFFRFFRKLAGMTGTAREAADEFWHVYHLPVITIPTHRPCVRRMLPDRVFADPETKWDAVVQDISRIHTQGRPILVGTRSIEASEHLARCLAREGLAFQLLNAVHHREEAQIVAQAGQAGQITIATNMAGRGTDILLGPGVVAMGGLHVIATERHESGRIDRQLFGRGARQGDPGSAQAFLSLDDELFRRFLPQTLRGRVRHAVAHRLPGASLLARQAAALSQYVAQRQAYRQRCAVLRMDTWLDDALSFTSASSSA